MEGNSLPRGKKEGKGRRITEEFSRGRGEGRKLEEKGPGKPPTGWLGKKERFFFLLRRKKRVCGHVGEGRKIRLHKKLLGASRWRSIISKKGSRRKRSGINHCLHYQGGKSKTPKGTTQLGFIMQLVAPRGGEGGGGGGEPPDWLIGNQEGGIIREG